jgi:hypothetical protein
MELASLYTKEELISVADFARVDNCMSGNKDKYPIGNDCEFMTFGRFVVQK